MDHQKFESLVRNADPNARRGDEIGGDDSSDPLLRNCGQLWIRLAKRRSRRRKNRSLFLTTAAASFLALVVARPWRWGNDNVNDPIVAERTTDRPMDLPSDAQRIYETQEPSQAAKPQPVSEGFTDLAYVESESVGAIRSRRTNHTRRMVSTEAHAALGAKSNEASPWETELLEQQQPFLAFIESAGQPNSEKWFQASAALSQRPRHVQLIAVDLVGRIGDADQQASASALVLHALPGSRRSVLGRWLGVPSLRRIAWEQLLQSANYDELEEMISLASDPAERSALCVGIQRWGRSNHVDSRAMWLLVQLTEQPHWRDAVRDAAADLKGNQVPTLIEWMRDCSTDQQTAIAFLLASASHESVDRALAEMIIQGRYRQPAYLALLTRDSAMARQFLNHAAVEPSLRPALLSAQFHSIPVRQRLQQWAIQSNGDSNATRDISPYLLRIKVDQWHLVVCLDNEFQLGTRTEPSRVG